MTNTLSANNRLPWLDVIRMLAMIMVIGVHCIDPFYISPTLGQIPEYRHWAAVYGSLLRPSVPLFVMMTGLLLLPVREMKPGAFYRKRIFSVLLFAAGYAVTYTGFSAAAADPASTEPEMELFFTFCSPNVAMMTAAVFILMQKIRISNGKICSILANLTKCGFGIYMVHYFLVGPAFILIGKAGLPIPLQVPVMAAAIFLVSWGFTWLMYRIFGEKARYVMG